MLFKQPLISCYIFEHQCPTVFALCAPWPRPSSLTQPGSAPLRPAHSTGQTAGPLISSFRPDQWHWWQEAKCRLWPSEGRTKRPSWTMASEQITPEWEVRGCDLWERLVGVRPGPERGAKLVSHCRTSWTNSCEQGWASASAAHNSTQVVQSQALDQTELKRQDWT